MLLVRRRRDAGWAWVVLAAAFLGVLLTCLHYTAGVFNLAFLRVLGLSKASTAVIAATPGAAFCTACPLSTLLHGRLGTRVTVAAGGLLAAAGYLATTASASFTAVFFTFGVCVGVGQSLSYIAIYIAVSQYFTRYRTVAYAVCTAAGGMSVIMFSPLCQYLLTEYGLQGTMLILTGLNLNFIPLARIFVPPDEEPTVLEMTLCDGQNEQAEKEEKCVDVISVNNSNYNGPCQGNGVVIDKCETIDVCQMEGDRMSDDECEENVIGNENYEDGENYEIEGMKNGFSDECVCLNSDITTEISKKSSQLHDGPIPRIKPKVKDIEIIKCNSDYELSTTSNGRCETHKQRMHNSHSECHVIHSNPLLTKLDHSDKSQKRTASMLLPNHFRDVYSSKSESVNGGGLIHRGQYIKSSQYLDADLGFTKSAVYCSTYSLPVNLLDTTKPLSPALDNMNSSSGPGHLKSSMIGPLIELALDVRLWLLNFSCFFILAAVSIIYLHFPAYAVSNGTSEEQAALLVPLLGVASTVCVMVTGAIASHPRVSELIVYVAACFTTGLVLLLCPGLFLAGYAGQAAAALLIGAAGQAYNGMLGPAIIHLFGLTRFGAAFGIALFFEGMGFVAGPPFAGLLFDKTGSYQYTFYVASAGYVLGALCMLFVYLIQRRRSKKTTS